MYTLNQTELNALKKIVLNVIGMSCPDEILDNLTDAEVVAFYDFRQTLEGKPPRS